MKTAFTLQHLFKLAGKKGTSLGPTEAPALYFDGQRALAANADTVAWIDCPQPLTSPILIPVSDIKTAMAVAPTLSLRDCGGYLTVNDVRVSAMPGDNIPPETRELIEFDRTHWKVIVRPFRFDGTRLGQVVTAAAETDIRFQLNGVYFDFAGGAIVATDGYRIHLVEDAVPVTDLPQDQLQGAVVPVATARLLAGVGSIHDIFVLQQQTGEPPPRIMCIAAANAKFRVRTIATERYVEYMKFFEQRRNQPVQMLLSAEDIPAIAAVMRVAETNSNNPCITLAGAERRITVSHANRIQKQLAAEYPVGAGFSVDLKAKYLRAAIAAAGHFGSAITLRFSPDDSNGVYIGAQAFHSVVMAMRPEKEEVDEADPATAEEHCL